MSVAQGHGSAPCRFRGQHPTVARPASRISLVSAVGRTRAGVLCRSTVRGLRASSRPRLRDSRQRRPAARNSPPRRTS
ncbi:MAG TPA: hypothetical protein VEW08_18330 [Steroidobacteraceae bacterium]|nr:hypothetical protein [Steroidobacteraceae bacterium]